tara:strand:+ start:221 stop:457 length:237 start_codon:yes stop_codon:yes gene_type:complete
MITTIQINSDLKEQLRSLKKENQTFEDIIRFLIKERETNKTKNIQLIKEEARVLEGINKEISNELENTEERGSEIVEW